MKNKGFTLIELIIAVGLAAVFLPALVFVYSFSLGTASQGENYTHAYALAQGQMEAIYYLKENDSNWDWQNYPDNNLPTDYYQPENISGVWELGPKKSGEPVADNGFAATTKILPVNRLGEDVSDDAGSILDPSSRKITVTVTWKEKGIPTEINLISYVSQH